jgi:hypothetical protein
MKDSPIQYVYPCKSATNELATRYSELLLLLPLLLLMIMKMGNDDSENNDKYLVISTIHEAFQSQLFSTLWLLDPS